MTAERPPSLTALSLIALVAATLAWCAVLPGTVAYLDGAFTRDQVVVRLAAGSGSAAVERLAAYERERASIERATASLRARIVDQARSGSAPATLLPSAEAVALEAYLTAAAERARPQLRISGFVDNETTLYFTLLYLGLGSLVLVGGREAGRALRGPAWPAGFAGYAAVQWVNWFRNTPPGQFGRSVYSYVHADVSLPSFLLQELRIVGMFLLLGAVWHAQRSRLAAATVNVSSRLRAPIDLHEAVDTADEVRRLFAAWQRDSILLACAFLPWTWFYWTTMTNLGDPRYWISAVLWHVVWLLTWVAISLPLLTASRAWTLLREHAMADLAAADSAPSSTADAAGKVLAQLDPLPQKQLLAAAATSVLSFVLPLLDAAKIFG